MPDFNLITPAEAMKNCVFRAIILKGDALLVSFDNSGTDLNSKNVEGAIKEINGKFSGKMDSENPVGTGSFSLNRKANTTVGYNSVAMGVETEASGQYSHAEGMQSKASGEGSHAEGRYTEAKGNYQHVLGKYNVVDNNNQYAEIIGNGTHNNHRSNARTLDWSGNETLAGDLVFNGNVSLTQALAQINETLQALRQATGLN